jgi:signal transduction histidine kinase
MDVDAARRALVVAVLYVAAARYSSGLYDLLGPGAVFWPAAGITVSALLVSPRRSWPAIVAAVGLAEFGNDLLLGSAVWSSAWWAAANMVEPLATVWLIRRWRADRLDSVRAVMALVGAAFLGPVLGGAIGAIGAIGTSLMNPLLSYLAIVGQWTVGDGLGILTVAPLGLALSGKLPPAGLRSREGVLALAFVATLVALVFGLPEAHSAFAADYLVLLPMVWVAVRFQVAGAAAGLFITAQLAIALHALGRGPFTSTTLSPVEGSAQLQLFLAAVGVTALLLACRTAESVTYHDLADTRRQLIDAVSHELRTPLTAIVGFSELLLQRETSLPAESRRGLEIIHRNSRHLTLLVDDLLQASRSRRGVVPVHPEPIKVVDLLGELCDTRAGCAVEVIGADSAIIWADRTHVTQMVTNLVENARRHGRPPLVLELATDGRRTQLTVADHGDGVPDWFLPELFEAFAQATSGDRRPTLGLGLGLPIARSLAIANGGDLRYAGSSGGARFVLDLPAVPAATAPAVQAAAAPAPAVQGAAAPAASPR